MGSSEIVAAEVLQGDPVVNRRGELLGTVEDLAIDVRRGRVAYALVTRDGTTRRLLPIPWEALDREGVPGRWILDMDPGEMERAPCLDADDADWALQVREFYRVPGER